MHINDILTHHRAPEWRAKFDARVQRLDPDECWEWQGAFDTTTGYGFVTLGKTHRTHRVAWIFANGPIPHKEGPRGWCICHTCDNRACCNPKHLFIGSDRDNALDAQSKRRMAHSDQHYAAKFTVADIAAIRSDTRPVREIAAAYDASKATIYGIQRGDTWKYVDAPLLTATRQKPERKSMKGISRPRKTRVPDDVVLAMRQSTETYSVLAARYGVSTATVRSVVLGHVATHLPLAVAIERRAGRKRGPNYQPAPPPRKLANLRRAVEAVLASREEMDEGWFVPTDAMQKLKEQIE